MKKISFVITILLILISNITAQTSYPTPVEFQKSFEDKTRDTSGMPGVNYFTNYSDYTIEANFNPETGKIDGSEQIIYHNNSNDTLNSITIRLYYNLFQSGAQRDFPISSQDLNSGVLISLLQIGAKNIDLSSTSTNGTNLVVKLPENLAPKGQITLKINWQAQVPLNSTVRTGRYGKNNYLVAYWYPQIAVYDDVFGWDNNVYTGAQEFYNDHSNFDVNITVAAPYLVWGAGVMTNVNDVYTKKYADLIKKATYSDTVIKILTQADYKDGKILKDKKANTFHYTAEKVPDFAFAVSQSHNWDAVGISMPDRTQRVLISGIYADSSKIYHRLAEVSRKIISYFSFQKPQIYYPYTTMNVFEGQGGMEYPMMVNIGDIEDSSSFFYVVAHEVGHTYFPFYCGTNETRYAWMDEGFINFFPRYAVDEIFKCHTLNDVVKNYQKVAGSVYDLPIMIPSNIFKNFTIYRNIAYNRPAYAFLVLHDYLGDSLFFAVIREFANRWHYKHPYPLDFINTTEQVTKSDLSWFFIPYFYQMDYADLAITNVKVEGGIYFTVENKGGLPMPINVLITYQDGRTQTVTKDISCWKNSNHIDFYIPSQILPKNIIFADQKLVDINLLNNQVKF